MEQVTRIPEEIADARVMVVEELFRRAAYRPLAKVEEIDLCRIADSQDGSAHERRGLKPRKW